MKNPKKSTLEPVHGSSPTTKLPPRIQVGDRVFVRGWPPRSLEVISIDGPSFITLQSPHGGILKVGRLAAIPAELGKDSTGNPDALSDCETLLEDQEVTS
jgi:hypothetical protein